MKEVDYIIVGLGIAGISFAEQLTANNKSFVVIDKGHNAATRASGGVFNPTVLKRFTAAWNASQFIATAFPFYKTLSEKLGIPLVEELPIFRILTSIEEQNNWMIASDKLALLPFLSSEIYTNENPAIAAPFGLGRVNEGGRIFPAVLLKGYQNYLTSKHALLTEAFDYNTLSNSDGRIQYKNFSARKIVFAEGAAVANNPWFPKQTLIGNKGEYIIIKAPQLKLASILKGPMMIIPLGNDTYKVGASYARDDYSYHTTEEAAAWVEPKLKKMIRCDYTVIDQVAGVRPTTKDRRPLLGAWDNNSNYIFFNGLGTRGILAAPKLSEILFDWSENDVELPSEVNINRFN